jgi:hypothetical protein
MTSQDRPLEAEGERARAVQRLNEVVTARKHLRDQRATAKGTSGEARADAALRVADDHVTARERWLNWVDERAD